MKTKLIGYGKCLPDIRIPVKHHLIIFPILSSNPILTKNANTGKNNRYIANVTDIPFLKRPDNNIVVIIKATITNNAETLTGCTPDTFNTATASIMPRRPVVIVRILNAHYGNSND